MAKSPKPKAAKVDRAVSRRFGLILTGRLKDRRPGARSLLRNIHKALPRLRALLRKVNDHWVYEDGIYRFYHQSFKVFHLQAATLNILEALQSLDPTPRRGGTATGEKESATLNPWFLDIVKEGAGKPFSADDNERWPAATRPILEAFLHARYFLEMAVKYGKELKDTPGVLPSGWASLLYLFNLR